MFQILYILLIGCGLFTCNIKLPASQAIPTALFSNEEMQRVPTAFKGRFRPLDSYARLWLSEFYGHEQIRKKDLENFMSADGSAQDLLWKIHFLGHFSWDNAPLFKIESSSLKEFLKLSTSDDYFSYNQLQTAFTNVHENITLSEAVTREKENVEHALRQYAQMHGSAILNESALTNALASLKERGIPSQEIALQLEGQFPVAGRLAQADSLLRVLPGKRDGEWLPLKALKVKAYNPRLQQLEYMGNFTAYSNEIFNRIRTLYLDLDTAMQQYAKGADKENPLFLEGKIKFLSQELAKELNNGYTILAGKPYKASRDKSIVYPSSLQLDAEVMYYRYPTIALTMIAYAFAGGAFLLSLGGYFGRLMYFFGWGMLALAFFFHTLVLGLRCFILTRPPVSNMYETVIYVPWITVLASFILYWKFRDVLILIAASLAATVLFILLQVTNISSGLENVQAVLDSQYWLIIHVLMIVGSYGVFALSGILAHLYLGCYAYYRQETPVMKFISKCMVQAIYLGVALLIPGTILGGVWAAESWGRFWDWDPKESWAFISICIYLIWIHAYTFHHVRNFGLAVGAVIGMMAVSFTWYGVNYVLGTGLHSYGFGSGGEQYYYLYLLAECLFLGWVGSLKVREHQVKC